MQRFDELDERQFAGAALIIDVDGTLTRDTHTELEIGVADKLSRIVSIAASVSLFSNGSRERTRALAEKYSVGSLDSLHRKPSRRVMEKFTGENRNVVVIGDKALTDGLFAANIGARFVPVAHIRHGQDSFFIRTVYRFDDLASSFVSFFFPILPYVALMRPLQWVKNLLVFAPVFFAVEGFKLVFLGRAALAALAFCALSSAMYVLNDMLDVPADRLHPAKRWRPIASGAASTRGARILLALLLIAFAAFVYTVPAILPVALAYAFGNICYSFYLKRVAVVDIILVAVFYIARVVAGGAATGIYVSPWIVLCVFFGALFLVVGKRRAELAHAAKRTVLSQYSQAALDHLLAASAVLSVTSYGLYSVLAARSPLAIYSTVFVCGAIFRLLNRLYRSDEFGEYPEVLVFKDRWVLAMGLLWAVYMFALLYLGV